MTTEMITVKLENNFLKEIDDVVYNNGYQNRTEFIRSALRDKVEEAKRAKADYRLFEIRKAIPIVEKMLKSA